MKKYLVTGLVTISVHTFVEASSSEEAREKALDHPMVGLCHQCAGGKDQEEWVTSGELDGEVEIVNVEVQ